MARLRLCLLSLCAAALVLAQSGTLENSYREVAAKLIGAAKTDTDGYRKLVYLCDRIGNRIPGSPALREAIVWAAEQMRRDGLENVATQPVKVQFWVRGGESAALVTPVRRPLTMLGLGGSIATPPGGITAEVVPVGSLDELEKLGRERVAGKIVLYNVPYVGYARTVHYRTGGPSRAAHLGAVASLVRSVASASLQSPHTGVLNYLPDEPKIPAAAVTVEDALLIQRLVDSGEKVTVHLEMNAQTVPNGDSANAMGEIRGREKPEEIVVLGGHIDSWDVGTGAQDDGSGCIGALQAVALIRKLGLRPRRTIRVVFWTDEEQGSSGGRAYRESLGDKVANHVAAIEMDGGAETPLGFGFSLLGDKDLKDLSPRTGLPNTLARAVIDPREQAAFDKAVQIGALLRGIGAGDITPGGGGADIGPLMKEGVPGFGLRTTGAHYFDWHHSAADTPDKVNPEDFRSCIAALAVLAYVLADMPDRLAP